MSENCKVDDCQQRLLRAEIKQLQAALNTICGITLGSASCDGGGKIHKIAIAALSTSDHAGSK